MIIHEVRKHGGHTEDGNKHADSYGEKKAPFDLFEAAGNEIVGVVDCAFINAHDERHGATGDARYELGHADEGAADSVQNVLHKIKIYLGGGWCGGRLA